MRMAPSRCQAAGRGAADRGCVTAVTARPPASL